MLLLLTTAIAVKGSSGVDIVPAALNDFSVFGESSSSHPIYAEYFSGSSPRRSGNIEQIVAMPVPELALRLPRQNGLVFVPCPMSGCGNSHGTNWEFVPGAESVPDRVRCKSCQTLFPNPDFPETGLTAVKAPSGKTILYSYYEKKGFKYYLSSLVHYRQIHYYASQAKALAVVFLRTQDEKYAGLAAMILCHFAKVYGDFVYKYDFPSRLPRWYDGIPSPPVPDWRGTRWNCWAYLDIPTELVLTYDLIYHSNSLRRIAVQAGLDLEADIERGFFLSAARGALINEDTLDNMGPRLWYSLVITGRVASAPDLVHIALARTTAFFRQGFYYDGFWKEASISYHQQALGGVQNVIDVLNGYSDPPGYISPYGGAPIVNFSGDVSFGNISRGLEYRRLLTYPDGYTFALADSWGRESREPLRTGRSSFLLPAVGVAMLSEPGSDGMNELYLSFTAKRGHHHFDTLNLSYYGAGRELISDIGYTHTRYRSWPTSTMAHNLVVVDYASQQNQGTGAGRGELEYLEMDDKRVRFIAVDGRRAYPQTREYRRLSMVINMDASSSYVVDFFPVDAPGQNLDYFWHGSCNLPETTAVFTAGGQELQLTAQPIVTQEQLPEFIPPASENEWDKMRLQYYNYGYMRHTRSAAWRDSGRVAFRDAANTGVDLYLPLVAGEELTLFAGDAPPIRQAQEDNLRLEDGQRQFVMLRHSNPSDRYCFAAVLESIEAGRAGKIQSVFRLRANLLRVELAHRIDYIFIEQPEWLELTDRIKVKGDYGVVGINKATGSIEFCRLGSSTAERAAQCLVNNIVRFYAPPPVSCQIEQTLDEQTVQLRDFSKLKPFIRFNSIIRLVNPVEGTVNPYRIKELNRETGVLRVEGSLGFRKKPADQEIVYHSFPHEAMPGDSPLFFYPENQPEAGLATPLEK